VSGAEVVGAAAVEITSDLSHFGSDARRDIERSTDQIVAPARQAGRQAGEALTDEANSQATRRGGLLRRAGGQVGDHFSQGVRSHLAGLAGAFAGALSAGTIVEFFKTGFDEAKDASAGQAQLEAGIKSTGNAANVTVDQMEELASTIQNYSGQTDDSIVATEQLLLRFTNIRNVAGKNNDIFTQTTKLAADMAAKMGTDATSAATILGKSLNDPVKGMALLARQGVKFTDAQKAQITAMVKSGNTIGAQKVLLAGLQTAYGGAAKAAGDSLPGKMARARRSMEDAAQSAAGALTPAIAGFANILATKVFPALSTMIAFVQNNWSWISKLLIGIVALTVVVKAWMLATRLATVWQGVQAVLSGEQAAATGVQTAALLAQRAAQLAVAAATRIWTAVQAAFNLVMSANPIILVGLAIVALVAIIVLIATKTTWFQTIWRAMTTAVGAAALWVWHSAIEPSWHGIQFGLAVLIAYVRIQVAVWSAVIRAAGAVAMWLWRNAIAPAFAGIKAAVSAGIAVVRAQIAIGVAILRGFGTATLAIGRAFASAYTAVKSWISNIVSTVASLPGKIVALGGRMLSAGKSLITQLFNGLKQTGGVVGDIGKDIVNRIINGLNTILPHKLTINTHIPGIGKKSFTLFPEIPYLATGGKALADGFAMVGEQGPEIVKLAAGDAVYPTGSVPSEMANRAAAVGQFAGGTSDDTAVMIGLLGQIVALLTAQPGANGAAVADALNSVAAGARQQGLNTPASRYGR
jgi:hypothetical protein